MKCNKFLPLFFLGLMLPFNTSIHAAETIAKVDLSDSESVFKNIEFNNQSLKMHYLSPVFSNCSTPDSVEISVLQKVPFSEIGKLTPLKELESNNKLFTAGGFVDIVGLQLKIEFSSKSTNCMLSVVSTENQLFGLPGEEGGPTISKWSGMWFMMDNLERISQFNFDKLGNLQTAVLWIPYQHPKYRDYYNDGNQVPLLPSTKFQKVDEDTYVFTTVFPEIIGVYQGDFQWVHWSAPTTIEAKLDSKGENINVHIKIKPTHMDELH